MALVELAVTEVTKLATQEISKALLPAAMSELQGQIEQITAQSPFEVFKSDLDLLINRYKLDRSYFDQFAHWYGVLAIWKKIVLGLSIGCGLLLTTVLLHQFAIINLAFFITINSLVFVFCTTLTTFLSNHFTADERRCERMCVDVRELTENLKNSIQAFQDIQTRLYSLLEETQKKNDTLVQYAATLEKQIEVLNSEVQQFQETVASIRKTQQLFVEGTVKLGEQEQVIRQFLAEISPSSKEESNLDEEGSVSSEEFKEAAAFFTSFHDTLKSIKQSQKNRLSSLQETQKTLEKELEIDNKTLSSLEAIRSRTSQLDLLIEAEAKEAEDMNAQAKNLLAEVEQLLSISVR